MSMSMLKKSMAIVEEDMESSKKNKQKETTVKKKGFKPNKFRYEEPAIKKPSVKKTIKEIRQEMESSSQRAEDNVNKLLTFTKHSVKIKNAEKILQRIHNGKYVVKKEEPVVEQESIFTEEDFANFEKELANTI
ncbi:uncharacterized protein LOC129949729 [Eupeodes corollae]|uniref:uncharacterized protein LOC129949729 n=1 Tax=Eupeodes corollae TaxID=290404 RepID=UPI0024938949|nr:uncharacterized protein LOC129949729 [Eupeodes corollae]